MPFFRLLLAQLDPFPVTVFISGLVWEAQWSGTGVTAAGSCALSWVLIPD